MKHTIIIATLMALLLTGCAKEREHADSIVYDTAPERHIPAADIPTPLWATDTNYDYSNSMTAIVAVDLMQTYPDLTPDDWQVDKGDLVGAFDGRGCIGVSRPSEGLFFLYITSPAPADAEIRLQYYSARLRNIFQADAPLHFENGARLGSVTDPLTPAFTQ